MSGEGRPDLRVEAAGMRVGVVATRWNERVVDAMLARALAAVADCGAVADVAHVAGSIELPVIAQQFAASHDAVVCLGAVVRGGTPHFDYVCRSVTDGLTRVALDAATPVGNGVLTCDTLEQALDRCGLPDSREDKGWEATMAAIDAAVALRRLRHQRAQSY
ncbi:MAG TPA: 6,7-dimethyl-8-ribityllumazine synthase [Streptosporangiales bacterium]